MAQEALKPIVSKIRTYADITKREFTMITRRMFLASAAVAPLLAAPTMLAQDAAPMEVTVEQGISYGEADGQSLILGAYRPPSRDTPRPAMLVFPGWGGGREYVAPNARALAEGGYVTFVADYRLSFATFLDDARLAVQWVRDNAATYEVDPERVGAYGHSAGGQLAVLLGTSAKERSDTTSGTTTGGRIGCSVSVAGVGDVSIWERDSDEMAVVTSIVGMPPEQVLEELRDQSPVELVDEQSAPAMLLHGGQDEVLSPDHSRNLAAALHEAGVETVFVFLPELTHVPIIEWELGSGLVLAFLGRHLHPED